VRVEVPGRRERGAAVLMVTMAIFLASLLATLYVNRNLIFEQRSSADQYRSTQAFEAAEAGVEWTLALLNDARKIGSDCLPTTDSAASSFRVSYLDVATALRPTCVLGNGSRTCGCPLPGTAALKSPPDVDPAPAFSLRFIATAVPGIVTLTSTGCTSLAGACLLGAATNVDAVSVVSIEIGFLPTLQSAPAATLTTRGPVDANAASIGLNNADPATSLVLQAGGHIAAAAARVSGPAGGAGGNLMVGDDAGLSTLSLDRFFASYFGLGKAAWKGQPLVQHVHCDHDCGAALISAVAAASDGASIWVDGDLLVSGPLTLGTVQQPVVLVVDGTAQLVGAVKLNGVLYASAIQWNTATTGASIHGAAISEGGYSGDGAPDLFYDAAVLAALKKRPSSFARVSGSWHDQ
jgi:hypothetical protein